MKRNMFKQLLLLAGFAALAGCEENLTELSKGENTLTLSASKPTLTLDERDYARTAVEFSWTTGTNYGTGNAIDYRLEITPDGTDYADGLILDLGRKVYSKSYNTEEFNEVLRAEFNAEPGVETAYRARVTAQVAADKRIQTSEITFTVTPYMPVTETLYLLGGATPNGWSADDATEMKRLQPGVFTWTGLLKADEFKLIVELGKFSPSYSCNPASKDGTDLIYNGSEDKKFVVAQAGGYLVRADLLNLKITLTPVEISRPPYDKIFFVAEANGFSFIPMTQDPVNPFIFRHGAVMQKGQFKFGTAQGSWEAMYKAAEKDNAPISSKGVIFVSGLDPDNKWLLEEDQAGEAYKITLDITPDKESMTMARFTPYAGMWMVGDATPSGWSLDNATELPKDGTYTFTWTGQLNTGELKFSCDKDTSWNGAWFMASEDQKEFAAGEEIITLVDKKLQGNGSVDRKWRIKTAGNYTITLNQLTEKMTVTKN